MSYLIQLVLVHGLLLVGIVFSTDAFHASSSLSLLPTKRICIQPDILQNRRRRHVSSSSVSSFSSSCSNVDYYPFKYYRNVYPLTRIRKHDAHTQMIVNNNGTNNNVGEQRGNIDYSESVWSNSRRYWLQRTFQVVLTTALTATEVADAISTTSESLPAALVQSSSIQQLTVSRSYDSGVIIKADSSSSKQQVKNDATVLYNLLKDHTNPFFGYSSKERIAIDSLIASIASRSATSTTSSLGSTTGGIKETSHTNKDAAGSSIYLLPGAWMLVYIQPGPNGITIDRRIPFIPDLSFNKNYQLFYSSSSSFTSSVKNQTIVNIGEVLGPFLSVQVYGTWEQQQQQEHEQMNSKTRTDNINTMTITSNDMSDYYSSISNGRRFQATIQGGAVCSTLLSSSSSTSSVQQSINVNDDDNNQLSSRRPRNNQNYRFNKNNNNNIHDGCFLKLPMIQGIGIFDSIYIDERIRIGQNINGGGARIVQLRIG